MACVSPSPQKPKLRVRKKYPSYAAFPMHGPPVEMHLYDWHHEMINIDKRIYCLMKKKHPNCFSPEAICAILKNVTLEQVWESLDSKVMRRYVFRRNKMCWNLLTQGQVEAQAQQAVLQAAAQAAACRNNRKK